MPIPSVKLSRGIHVMHLFYKIDRAHWGYLDEDDRAEARVRLEKLCSDHPGPAHPRVATYVNVGGKADLVVMLYAAELGQISALQRSVELAFPAGTLETIYTYLSVTELPDYVTSEEDMKRTLTEEQKLQADSPEFAAKLEEFRKRQAGYEQYRLYPEMQDWPVMAFYPMSKRRQGNDNWYSLPFDARKQLMLGHARVGRKYAGRVSQLITGSTGLDDFEWGVTLIAHQTDAIKEIVYEMRFDEVTARFGEFGPFFINLRLSPADLWEHLKL